ncbi:hypothetical protein D3C76_1317680 [compost metagenome]
MTVQHRQQNRQTVLFQAHRHATRVTHHRMIDQRLDLHQQRARPFPDHHHRAAGGDFIAAAQEDGRRVADFTQPMLGHGKHAQLIHRAEAVFMAAQGTETGVGVAVQHHGAVDTVLEHFWTGQGAIFGDVTDHDDRYPAGFGEARQVGRGLTHLGDAARRGLHVGHVHHLDGVDHH